ncbi:MAG: hypothetical protein ABI690_26975 [Chloroflexota bacterium]
MNILSWENEVQRHRDMQRKAQAAALAEIAFTANRQRNKKKLLQTNGASHKENSAILS